MSNYKLQIAKVTKAFSNKGQLPTTAVSDVSFNIREGEIVSLIGPSGCGKSTLLDIISGLIFPDEGEVFLDGINVTGNKGVVSYMPQKDVLFPWRTVLDNVIVPLELAGVNRATARKEAKSLLPVFELENFGESYPYELSGGMRQRASFLRTYLSKKDVMLLDEPFGKLDALTRGQLQQWLLGLWESFKKSILLVTHDIDEAILLSDRIYILSPRPGRITCEVKVGLTRPRPAEIKVKSEYTLLKAELMNRLEEGSIKKGGY